MSFADDLTALAAHLATVSTAYYALNQADYDTAREWTQAEALDLIKEVLDAFRSWDAICDEPVAQAYLVSLLGKERGRA